MTLVVALFYCLLLYDIITRVYVKVIDMSINLFLRPLASANIEYEYKTNVLSTYNNLEDRIAQRDVPRITFNYSYMLNDYGMTNELQNALQNNGSVNSFWLPDWFAFVEVSNIVAGTNTVDIDYYNSLTKGEYVIITALQKASMC